VAVAALPIRVAVKTSSPEQPKAVYSVCAWPVAVVTGVSLKDARPLTEQLEEKVTVTESVTIAPFASTILTEIVVDSHDSSAVSPALATPWLNEAPTPDPI